MAEGASKKKTASKKSSGKTASKKRRRTDTIDISATRDVRELAATMPPHRKSAKTVEGRVRQLANLRMFRTGNTAAVGGKGPTAQKRRASLRQAVRDALKMRLTDIDVTNLEHLGVEIENGITYREAIAAKIVSDALRNSKAVDQLIALEPKELEIDLDADVRQRSVSAIALAQLPLEDRMKLLEIQKKLAAAAGPALDAEVDRVVDDAEKA